MTSSKNNHPQKGQTQSDSSKQNGPGKQDSKQSNQKQGSGKMASTDNDDELGSDHEINDDPEGTKKKVPQMKK